jgi:hypothetical protein
VDGKQKDSAFCPHAVGAAAAGVDDAGALAETVAFPLSGKFEVLPSDSNFA